MGKLFVIDGTDGSGKQTQLEKLKQRLTQEKIEFKSVSFPNYESPSSSLVKIYLNGELSEDVDHSRRTSRLIAGQSFFISIQICLK